MTGPDRVAQEATLLFEEGLRLVREGKTQPGIEKWCQCIERYPGWCVPYGHLAWYYLQTGDAEWAASIYRRFLELVPNSPEGHFCYALALYRLGRFDESSREYREARSFLSPCDRRLLREWKRRWKENARFSPESPWYRRLRELERRSGVMRRIFNIWRAALFQVGHLLFALYEPFTRKKVLPIACTRDRKRRFSLIEYSRVVARRVDQQPSSRIAYARLAEAAIHSEVIGLRPGARVVDVGTGVNPLPLFWALKGMEVVCTDPDRFVLELEPVARRMGLKNAMEEGRLRILQADGAALPFPNDHFDYWTSISVIEHIPGRGDSAVMAEAARVLKPGGLAVVTTEGGPFLEDRWYCVRRAYFGKQYLEQVDSSRRRLIEGGSPPATFEEWKASAMDGTLALIRDYDREMLLERVVKPSGLELVEMGFLDSRFRTNFRGIVDGFARPWLGIVLRDIAPLVCYLTYRRFPAETSRLPTPAATAYVILRKPAG